MIKEVAELIGKKYFTMENTDIWIDNKDEFDECMSFFKALDIHWHCGEEADEYVPDDGFPILLFCDRDEGCNERLSCADNPDVKEKKNNITWGGLLKLIAES